MRKILASILAITMLMTTMSACVIPASAEEAVATGAFTENFENYGSGNWLANMAEDGKTVGTAIEGMSANQWTIYGGVGTTLKGINEIADSGASMEVVADPANAENKVLKLDAGNLATNSWFFFRRNANEGNKIARKDIPAKKMVVKAKYKLPADYGSSGDTSMLSYNSAEKPPRHYLSDQVGANYSSKSWTILASGSRTYAHNNNIKNSVDVPTEQWFEFKQVMDMTAHKTDDHPGDTYRGFLDGTIYTLYYPIFTEAMQTGNKIIEVNSKYPQPSTTVGEAGEKVIDSFGGYKEPASNTAYKDYGDYYGAAMILSGRDGSSTDYMYMDDLEVYYVDAFAQVGDAVIEQNVDGAWYKGTIKIPFNNDLMEVVKEVEYNEARSRGTDQYIHNTYTTNPTKPGEVRNEGLWNHRWIDHFYKDLFTLKDAEGNVVEGGITDAYVEGNYLVIEPSKLLERNKAYTVSASPLFMDVEGQGLNSFSKEQDIYTFNTAEDPFAHIIYSFDFEDNKVDGVNWIESRNGTADRYVVADGVELGAITINKHSSLPADHPQSITVENDPTGADNKVLALKAGYATGTKTTDPDPSYLTGWVTQIRFNANGKTGISRATDMGKGKNLVYKAKIFVPDTFAMTESSQLVNLNSETQATANSTSGIGATMAGAFYAATTGAWGSPMARYQLSLRGQWVEWKHVADVSEALSAEHSDTVRAYVNDIMMTTEFVQSNAASTGKVFGDNAKYDHNLTIGSPTIDYLSGGKDLFTVNPYASLGATWWGSAFTINPQVNTANGDVFYIDDVEAFWIDDLTFNAVNAANFEGGKVKLNFNQKIREEVDYMYGKSSYKLAPTKLALADLFKIVDLEGNVVENGIAAVTLSEDGKTVSITPDASLTKGGDYQIEISPYLVDEYGQGLLNNSKATYVDLHISETFTPFEMTEISQTEISGFAQGRDVKVTAKFSVAIDDESITNGIVVKNENGEVVARNNGWTAAFGTDEEGNADYKTITFDFGSLPTANYTVTINDKFLATNGAELASAFNIAINKANDRIVLFDEDFENYAQENWIADKYEVTDGTLYNGNPDTWSKVYYKSYTVNDHDWDIQLHYTTAAANEAPATLETNDFAGIAAAPDKASGKMSGNVLKLVSTRNGSYSDNYVSFRRNFNKLEGIDFSSEQYKGKKLVYEADIFADSVPSDNSFFVPFGGTNTKAVRDYNDWKMLFSSSALRTAGHYSKEFASAGAMAMYSQVIPSDGKITSAPMNYKIVVSMGENIDTTAMYVNGKLVQRPIEEQALLKGHEWNNSARHEFAPSDGTYGETLEVNDVLYGIWGLLGQGKTVRTLYMDNFKAYLVDEFNVESVEGAGNVFNTAKGAVTYTFSKPVDANVAANEDVVLLNENGEVVAGGIASITLSDAGYKMTVKLSDTLPGLTKYSIKLNETLKDVDGLALSTQWKYYEYPIADYYDAVAENVYSVTSIAGIGPIDLYYTPATATKPAYLATTAAGGNKAAIDTYVRDADAMKMFTVLTTSKATSLFATAGAAVVDGTNVSTTVTFTNPEVEEMNVWCVIAAFGEFNEMLGCETVEYTVPASESTEAIPVNFTTEKPGVKVVKMFVWNSYDDMKPYQKVEKIYE